LVRYVLNLKKLPYQTVYVEFPDIARVSKEAGIPPLLVKPDGTPYYTCPAIVDDTTGAAISDSYKIAEYLDSQYPETPRAFPKGTEALQAAFYRYTNDNLSCLVPVILPSIPGFLNDVSSEYYSRTRAVTLGKPLDQVKPVGEELEKTWEKVRMLFDLLESWYGKSSGVFMVGDKPSFADFVVGGLLQGVKMIRGERSQEWEKVKSWNNGRWIMLLSDLEEYANVDA
jgi:glutathione S-transferase